MVFCKKIEVDLSKFQCFDKLFPFPVFVSHCGWREMDYWSDYPFIIADSYVNV